MQQYIHLWSTGGKAFIALSLLCANFGLGSGSEFFDLNWIFTNLILKANNTNSEIIPIRSVQILMFAKSRPTLTALMQNKSSSERSLRLPFVTLEHYFFGMWNIQHARIFMSRNMQILVAVPLTVASHWS